MNLSTPFLSTSTFLCSDEFLASSCLHGTGLTSNHKHNIAENTLTVLVCCLGHNLLPLSLSLSPVNEKHEEKNKMSSR